MRLRSIVVFWMVGAALLLAACASVPARSRPTVIAPFLGTWSGTWRSDRCMECPNRGGNIDVAITADAQRAPNGVIYDATGADGMGHAFTMKRITGELRDGALEFVTPWKADLTFTLRGDDRIEVRYDNPANKDRGRWDLKRK